MAYFTPEQEDLLISSVAEYPCLFDNTDSGHKDATIKANAWRRIAQIMGKEPKCCKTKFRNLRDYYMRRRREGKLPTEPGAPKGPKWDRFERMRFLERTLKRRRTLSNVPSSSREEEESTSEVDSEWVLPELQNTSTEPSSSQVEEVSMEEKYEIPESQIEYLASSPGVSSLDEHSLLEGSNLLVKPRTRQEKSVGEEILVEIQMALAESTALLKSLVESRQKRKGPKSHFFEFLEEAYFKLPQEMQIEARNELYSVISKFEQKALDMQKPSVEPRK